MERRSSCAGGPLGSGTSRLATLLAASILSSCFLLTEGQGTYSQIQVVLQPPHPREGQNITLTPRDTVDKAIFCRWYRGLSAEENKVIFTYYFAQADSQTNGAAFTGRETAGPDCSLHIRKVTSEDTGNYTVNVDGPGINALGSASVVVSEILSSPVLWTTAEGIVKENTNVTLTCSTSNNPGVSVSWLKDNKPLPAVAGLTDQNRTLTLSHITKNDAGVYTCEDRNPVSSAKSNSTSITVAYGPEIKLNPEGSIEQTINSELKLECTADSVPAAQFQWYFNNTMRKETGSSLEVRFSNWTDEGNYTCQATNPFTRCSAMKSVYVTLTKVSDPAPALGAGAIAGIVIGTLAVTALIVGSLLYVFLRARGQRDTTSTQTVAAAAASTYENVLPSTQVKTDSSANSNHIYETLQHADQSVYQQLKGSRPVSQPASLS